MRDNCVDTGQHGEYFGRVALAQCEDPEGARRFPGNGACSAPGCAALHPGYASCSEPAQSTDFGN